MACAARRCGNSYNQELVRVMKEHELLEPEEEQIMTDYLFNTQ